MLRNMYTISRYAICLDNNLPWRYVFCQSYSTIQTRPTSERRKTLGHLRSISRNMIIHFANQSQACQFLKILTRSLYVAFFIAIFFFSQDPCTLHLSWPFLFFFVTFSFSIPVHWIFTSHLHFHSVALLVIFPEFWKWSGAPFPFCIVSLPNFLALHRPSITLTTGWLL